MHILINKKYLTYNQYKVKCAVGKRGIGLKKKEGDLITPIGEFRIKYILYRKDRVKKIQSKLKMVIIKKNMGWCNDPASKNYNRMINLPFSTSYERLFRKENIYDIILVLDYNMNPVIKNRGSAIFIHIAKKNSGTYDIHPAALHRQCTASGSDTSLSQASTPNLTGEVM